MKENEEEIVEVTVIDASAIEAQMKAEIDVQIATAHRFPRVIKRAKENAIVIATMDEETAKSCGYAVPRGGKSVSGPSVHLARIVVQQWGNLRISSKVVGIDAKQITCQAVCLDLETNLGVQVEIKRSISGKKGRFNDDMITVTGNAGNAIAFRNAVFAVVPKAVIDAVYKASREKILGDISDETKFLKKRASVFSGFKDTYAISEERVLQAIGLKAIGQIKPEHLMELIDIAQAIKDGDTTVDQAFPGTAKEEAEKNLDTMKEKMANKKDGKTSKGQ